MVKSIMVIQRYLSIVIFSAILSCPVFAGNKAMMEKRAEEVVKLNESILQQLDIVKQQGFIVLEAEVVFEDGQPIVYVEQLGKNIQQESSNNEPEIHSSRTRYGPIPQHERFTASNEQCYLLVPPKDSARLNEVKALFDHFGEVNIIEIDGKRLSLPSQDVTILSEKYLLINWQGK